MIEHHVWMHVTSADLDEMAAKAREVERTARIGDSAEIKNWNCGGNVYVRVTLDHERATSKGLMK